MASAPRSAGFTLIECMVSMAVLTIGSLGALSLQRVGTTLNADARVVTRATALATDMVTQIEGWSYDDPRLANTSTSNDSDITDLASGKFQGTLSTGDYDHAEAELESAGTWSGVPTAQVQALGFERYLNVAEPDTDTNGNVVGKRVAVIVRWPVGGGWRRIHLSAFIAAPNSTILGG